MKAHGSDRGGITLAILAPVLAAVIGGTAAVFAAAQIVNLAPANSDTGQSAGELAGDVEYGDR